MDYEFPYVVLASRFIDYFNVDVSNKIVDFTKVSSEIIERHQVTWNEVCLFTL